MFPDWLLECAELYGSEIIEKGIGHRQISKDYGLSEFKARSLLRYLKARVTDRPAGKMHLVVGDAHARPDQSLARFVWLGRMCARLRPDTVVVIGDWADMASLSSYDKGKKSFEGRRYIKDIEAANEALRLFHAQLPICYRPELVYITGNHEERVLRAANNAAEFDGLIGMNDLDFERRGWEVVPFLGIKSIDGIHYSHYFQSRNSPNAVAGEYAAASLIRQKLVSCVAGHSHLLDYARRADVVGRPISGLVVGCYTDDFESYAGPSNHIWWRGICVLNNVRDGDYDLELWSLDRIRSTFGGGLPATP